MSFVMTVFTVNVTAGDCYQSGIGQSETIVAWNTTSPSSSFRASGSFFRLWRHFVSNEFYATADLWIPNNHHSWLWKQSGCTNCGPKSFCSLLYFLPTVLTPKKGIYQQTFGSTRNTDMDTMCCIMGLIYSKFSSYFFPACTIQYKWACPKNTTNRPLCCKTIDTVLALPLFNSSFKFHFVRSLTTQGRHRAPRFTCKFAALNASLPRCRIEAGISRVAIMWRTTTSLPSALLDIASSQLITQMFIMGGQ